MITKEQLDEYIAKYNRGEDTGLSDEEYDNLLEEYLKKNGEDKRPFLRTQQTDDVNDAVGTLGKVYGVTKPMRPGQKTYVEWVNTKKINPKAKIIIQPKFDGCSVAYDCNSRRFFTRGDYDNGESVDVTELFIDYFDKNYDTEITAVKFEAIMAHEIFKDLGLNNRYKRPRDAVAGIITSRNVSLSKFITLVPLREYSSTKPKVSSELCNISITNAVASDNDIIQEFIDNKLCDGAIVEFNELHYSIDGVVVSVINNDGEVSDNEIAIKILNNIKETRIINIDYQYGKTGKITPVGILEPVLFDNVIVDHVGLSTLDRVSSLGLKYYDTVRIVYNIVPYLLDSYHDGKYPIPLPDKCPICGSPLNLRWLRTVRCTNPNCKGLKIGMIIRYCEQMKMFGVSKATITKLFDNGYIESISDLYKLTPERLQLIDGFKEKSATNICKSIRDASENVSLSRWLGALPFKDISAKKWQTIIENSFGNDEFKAMNVVKYHLTEGTPESFIDDMISQYSFGISVHTVNAIKEGLSLYWEDICETAKYVTFKITSTIKPIKGRVTLTGTRDKQLTEYLIERGYDVGDFSSKTIAIVVPDKSFTSSTVMKAIASGIPSYTIEEAYERLS